MKITLNNWLYNAGIVGMLRILRANGITFDEQLKHGYFELLPKHFERIADTYFSFLVKTFPERFFAVSLKADDKGPAIVKDFKQKIQTQIRAKRDEKIREISVHKAVGDYPSTEKLIRETIDALKVNAEEVIQREFEASSTLIGQNDIEKKQKEQMTKTLDKEREKASKIIRDYHDSLSKLFEKQKFVVDLLKRFYFNKNIIGNYSLSGSNRLEAFSKEFVAPAIRSLASVDVSTGVSCKFCNQHMLQTTDQKLVNIVFNEGLFSASGVSVGFENFYFNLQPDLFICDICEFILLCSWAGFNRIPYRFRSGENDTEFVFVNLPSLDLMLHENDRIQSLYTTASLNLKDTIYETIFTNLFIKEKTEKSQWVLQNVLFIEIKPVPRKDTSKPIFRYFHVGKDVAKLFTDGFAVKSMQFISGWAEVQKGLSLYLKKEIVRRFLNSEPVYDLAFKMLIQIVKNRKGNSYNLFCLACIDSIRKQIWLVHSKSNHKGAKPMESKVVYGILKGVYSSGAAFVSKMDFEKRQRLSYRMLSLIRNGKYADFYDALMKLHIDAGMSIPEILLGILNTQDAIEFEAKAYAFMSGFLKDVAGTKTAEEVNEPELIDEEKQS